MEKKGHSMAYFNWAVRHLVVRQGMVSLSTRPFFLSRFCRLAQSFLAVLNFCLPAGELAYYKEDDLKNALNIIPLHNASVVDKGSDGFLISANKV